MRPRQPGPGGHLVPGQTDAPDRTEPAGNGLTRVSSMTAMVGKGTVNPVLPRRLSWPVGSFPTTQEPAHGTTQGERPVTDQRGFRGRLLLPLAAPFAFAP